jgi:hypothetical protein
LGFFFDEVMASDGTVNLEGRHKAKALVENSAKKASTMPVMQRLILKLSVMRAKPLRSIPSVN